MLTLSSFEGQFEGQEFLDVRKAATETGQWLLSTTPARLTASADTAWLVAWLMAWWRSPQHKQALTTAAQVLYWHSEPALSTP
jgi:hypothetical protein